jgi:hypothetical protein
MKKTKQNQAKKLTPKAEVEPFIARLQESGLSQRLLAVHSGLPYIRVNRLIKLGFKPRPEEVARLQEGVETLFRSITAPELKGTS